MAFVFGLETDQLQLFKGELVWQIKPDPYVHNTVRHTDEDLNDFERRVHDELWAAYRRAPVKEMVEEEEVEVKEFEWENHSIRWEKFLKFDWTRGKNRFKDSTILKRYKSRTQSAMKEKPDKPMNSPSDEARKMCLARHYYHLDPPDKAFQKKDPTKLDSQRNISPKALFNCMLILMTRVIIDGRISRMSTRWRSR